MVLEGPGLFPGLPLHDFGLGTPYKPEPDLVPRESQLEACYWLQWKQLPNSSSLVSIDNQLIISVAGKFK
ncbi:hypothetical protein Y1Q_0009752 [Alligator mississippiensis]|uniref:Uncharacterized protein n=1 Tax=Alligator mississippiensis TaxID=8496 RepID=A0A151MWU7_ALLMI|nr:hypothetical protein Y1Q_0009752 [Alligator mississippiensis]